MYCLAIKHMVVTLIKTDIQIGSTYQLWWFVHFLHGRTTTNFTHFSGGNEKLVILFQYHCVSKYFAQSAQALLFKHILINLHLNANIKI